MFCNRGRTVGSVLSVMTAILAVAGLAQTSLAAPPAKGLTLVADGKPVCVVAADKDLSPSELWAVKELRTFIAEISGAQLQVVTPDNVPADSVLIVVGHKTAKARHPNLDLASLGDEGFIIQTIGNELIIAGGEMRGTMYGVYTLLEDLGCRWWTPKESFIPKLATIAVPATNRREVPRLEFRNIMYAEGFDKASRLWYVRNKLNGAGWEPIPQEFGGHYFVAGLQAHNTIKLVADAVGKDGITEDMWALAHVRRTNKTERVKTEVCQTNKDVIAATVKTLVKLYKDHPNTKYLHVAHEDNDDYCRCPTCDAILKKEGSSTGQWLYFSNIVAEELEKQVPGARIMIDAYGWTRVPPKNLKPRANVLVRFAPIESDWAHPLAAGSNPQNRKTKEDIEFWGRTSSMLSIWTYIGNRCHYLMPNPDFDSVVPNIKFFADNNAVGIMHQGTQAGVGSEFVSLRMWILGRALWNPSLDGGDLIKEFLVGYYGPAAPAIQKYIDIMHSYGRKNDYHLGRVARMSVPFLQPQIIAEAEAAMRQADAAVAGDPVLERRVRHAHLPVWYVLAKRGPLSPTWKAVEAKVGKLDFTRIAEVSNQTAKEWNIQAVADPEEAGPYFQWLTDYAMLLEQKKVVLPPELTVARLANTRLIQARQIDGIFLDRSGQWVKVDGASDGWALRVIKTGWMIQHVFSPYDEYTVGRKYKLYFRVKGGEVKGNGAAFTFGLTGDGKLPSVIVPAADLADGAFKVIELGPFVAGKDVTLYVALSRDGAMSEVFFDCLWLTEVK